MIVVRSQAEAAVYCHLTGHAVLVRRSPRPQAHVWECVWRDEPRQLTFVEVAGEGPSTLIDQAGFLQVGAELAASVPASPLGFVRGEARRCVADLVLASYAFAEALRFGPQPDAQAAQARVDALRSSWIAALPTLPEARPLAQVPLPTHGFYPPLELADWVRRPLPYAIDELPEALAVVARGADGRFLARHPAHTLAWITVSPDKQVTDVEILVEREGLAAIVQYGFSLLEVQKARLRACGQAGDPLADLLEHGLGEGRHRVVLELRAPERVRFIEVESQDPRFRGALLAVRLDPSERVLGFRVIEGLDGYEMMGLLDATAPHLPGPEGQPPVAESAARLEASLTAVGEAVRPVLEALLDPARAPAALEALRPRPGDAACTFRGDEADLAALDSRYATLWDRDPPRVRAPSAQVQLRIRVATAGMLLPDAPMPSVFPPAWARVAERLRPERTWVAWSYEPVGGGRGTDYDGLVWLDDRWVWFPAPWRVLALR